MNRAPAIALKVGFLRRVAINAVDDEQHHRGAEQIVVERAEELRDENRQEAARAQEMGSVLHGSGAQR